PNAHDFYRPNIVYTGFSNNVDVDTVAFSLFDTAHLTEQWILSGGFRVESVDSDFSFPSTVTPGTTFRGSRTDDLFSYRAAITYKPVEEGSIYLGYGTSFNPISENFSLGDNPKRPNYYDVDPEENRTIELGTKWELLNKNLLVSAALFRTDKTNARTVDPIDPTDVLSLNGKERVQGFEVGFTGLITEDWRVIGGYTYLDSEVRGTDNPLEKGNSLSNTPEHSFALWTVHDLPKGFQIGLGTQFVGSRYNSSNEASRQEAPSYAIFNALLGYQLNENVSFRLNGYNLTDKEYVDQVGGGHFVPGHGRSAVLTAEIKF
ncbi:MAG: TonB-dependent receptor, partial [Verrucomicrobiaceae bacterium]